MDYWRIRDFAKEVGKHQNTVDGWFKQLEKDKLHWVNRSEYGEKVYTSLDLKIAKYIQEKRDQKWALDVIFKELPKEFELRPVPEEETTSALQVYDVAAVRNELKAVAKEIAAAQVEEIKQQYEELMKRLPKPKSIEEERHERINEMITRRRVEAQLETEALNMWATKPESERKIRVGFFRKEEDRDKRERFVREYVNTHFEARIKEEYRME